MTTPFLFGTRGVGKSTLIKNFYTKNKTWYIDLLDLHQESKYLNDPQLLKAEVLALPSKMKWVVIDEVQKIPVLLNVIHALIEETDIARDVGVDDKSVIQYFSILEDTLLGFYLPAFQSSFRKRLSHKPKFYFIDIGIARALSRTLETPVTSRTYEYGQLFEHFVILECYKLSRSSFEYLVQPDC